MSEKQGLSPVIGVILLVGITVGIVGLASVFVFDIGSTDTQSNSGVSVTYEKASGTNVTVNIVKLSGDTNARIRTEAETITVSSPGKYTVETFGSEVTTLGKSSSSVQVISSYQPKEEDETLNVNEDDGLVAVDDGFDTLKQAHDAAAPGDVIIFESGVHEKPDTVNFTISKDVDVVFKEDTILSCEQENVNLVLNNLDMNSVSSIPKTTGCESTTEPISKPVRDPLNGIDVVASDSSSNNVTATVTTDKQYTFTGEFGSRTVSGAGVYEVNVSGGNSSVFAAETPVNGQESDTTSDDTSASFVSKVSRGSNSVSVETDKENVSYSSYLITPESGGDGASGQNFVSDVNVAVDKASDGDSIVLLSGTHTKKESVAPTIDKSVTILFENKVTLSCKDYDINFTSGSGSFGPSPAPNIECSSLNTDNTATVGDPIAPTETDSVYFSGYPRTGDGTFDHRGDQAWARPSGANTLSIDIDYSLTYNNCAPGVTIFSDSNKYLFDQTDNHFSYGKNGNFDRFSGIAGSSSGKLTYSDSDDVLKVTADGKQHSWSVSSVKEIEYFGCYSDKLTIDGTVEYE